MRDHHSTNVATAALLAREDDAASTDLPSKAEYYMDPEPPILHPRCPHMEATTGYAWQCADPSCRGGVCVRGVAE